MWGVQDIVLDPIGKKRRNTRQCLNTTFSHGRYRFATFFQTRMLYVLYTVAKILDSLGIYGDLQKWHLSLFYLGSLVCCGWRWCWHSWCAKAIKVTKIPKNTRSLIHKRFTLPEGQDSLGIIEIIFKVNFNHPEEGPTSQKGVRARLKIQLWEHQSYKTVFEGILELEIISPYIFHGWNLPDAEAQFALLPEHQQPPEE